MIAEFEATVKKIGVDELGRCYVVAEVRGYQEQEIEFFVEALPYPELQSKVRVSISAVES